VIVSGRRVRFDLAYPDARLAIELKGRAPHWGADRWQRDNDRENAVELGGWRMLPFTWRDVNERPNYVVLTIAAKLRLRPARWTAEKTPQRRRSTTLGRSGGAS
jgi:very-short-patch-repair endonuclease